ncbi:MAG TPA: four helix bundle protein [Verrucomicrobiae bacterium]
MIYDLRFMIYRPSTSPQLRAMNREELQARTKRFALRVMKMTDALPRSAKGKVIANQVLRSATAVASGYRAACRARSKADWIDKIGRVLEETDESLLWLELTEESALLPARRLAALKTEAGELTSLFAAIHKSSKS